MATTEALRYVDAQNGVVRLAVRDLRAFWDRLDHTAPLAAREALEGYWPVLLARYGEITATLAIDRFEILTGLPGVMVRPVDPERANARMRWAMGPAFEGRPEDSFARLALLVDELSKQPGRDTMARSARKRKIRVARVPTGKTCAWCLMMASRGPVFGSEATALAVSHGKCDCRLEPVMDDADLKRLTSEGYDLDRYRQIYADNLALTSKGRTDPRATLAAIRKAEDIH